MGFLFAYGMAQKGVELGLAIIAALVDKKEKNSTRTGSTHSEKGESAFAAFGRILLGILRGNWWG